MFIPGRQSNMMKKYAEMAVFLLLFLGRTFGQQMPTSSQIMIDYVNHNQIDPKPIVIRQVSGIVVEELGSSAKQLRSIPAILGLFKENDHKLVSKVAAENEGLFIFGSIRPGEYRLVIRDKQSAFCDANVPLKVVSWPRGSKKMLVIHMRPRGIDVCSYGELEKSN